MAQLIKAVMTTATGFGQAKKSAASKISEPTRLTLVAAVRVLPDWLSAGHCSNATPFAIAGIPKTLTSGATCRSVCETWTGLTRSEERRVGKECRGRSARRSGKRKGTERRIAAVA